jgi:hypothetical protein
VEWFKVSTKGLREQLAGHHKGFVISELVQNAWDQNVSRVDIRLEAVPGQPKAWIVVTDDDPDGFADLRHTYTLFEESAKKGDPEKRGRFNIGEKKVLVLCHEATITSTKGTIRFDKDGRHASRKRTERGSEFRGLMPLTPKERDEIAQTVRALLPPAGIVTTFNGEMLEPRTPITTIEATLPTVTSDADGVLRQTRRKTYIHIYEPVEGETPSLYELGIPVVETGDKYHYDVRQKVPLNTDRDNVPPAYLKAVRLAVLNATHDQLKASDANSDWVREASSQAGCSEEATRTVVQLRFGDRSVVRDPGDLEANHRAVARGYTLVSGGHFSPGEWENIRRFNALRPAGQVFPTPKSYTDDPKAPPERLVPESEWTPGMRLVADYARMLARELLNVGLEVRITDDKDVHAEAAYGRDARGKVGDLMLNLAHLGSDWFKAGATEDVDAILLHELAHHLAENHLSSDYHEAVCKLGAKLKRLALDHPDLFQPFTHKPS